MSKRQADRNLVALTMLSIVPGSLLAHGGLSSLAGLWPIYLYLLGVSIIGGIWLIYSIVLLASQPGSLGLMALRIYKSFAVLLVLYLFAGMILGGGLMLPAIIVVFLLLIAFVWGGSSFLLTRARRQNDDGTDHDADHAAP